jgi:hypothetical protein
MINGEVNLKLRNNENTLRKGGIFYCNYLTHLRDYDKIVVWVAEWDSLNILC